MSLIDIPSAESLSLPTLPDISSDIVAREIIKAHMSRKNKVTIDFQLSVGILDELKNKGYHVTKYSTWYEISW